VGKCFFWRLDAGSSRKARKDRNGDNQKDSPLLRNPGLVLVFANPRAFGAEPLDRTSTPSADTSNIKATTTAQCFRDSKMQVIDSAKAALWVENWPTS